MKLSIITPVYNGEETIVNMIRSVIRQTFSDWELIIVDDGSTDKTPKILEEVSKLDSRIRVIRKKNGGVSAARNTGVKNAKGEYIGFVDADDSINPDMYEKLVSAIENTSSDMALGGYYKITKQGKETVELPIKGELEGDDVKKIVYAMAFWDANIKGEDIGTMYGSTWPNLYRKKIIEDNKIAFPKGLRLGEDLIFNLSYLLYVNKTVIVNEPLYNYDIRNVSATRNKNRSLFSEYLILMDYIRETIKNKYEKDKDYKYNVWHQYLNYAISVLEEQTFEFERDKRAKRILHEIFGEPHIMAASKYMFRRGRTFKLRMQGYLFMTKQYWLIKRWLKK